MFCESCFFRKVILSKSDNLASHYRMCFQWFWPNLYIFKTLLCRTETEIGTLWLTVWDPGCRRKDAVKSVNVLAKSRTVAQHESLSGKVQSAWTWQWMAVMATGCISGHFFWATYGGEELWHLFWEPITSWESVCLCAWWMGTWAPSHAPTPLPPSGRYSEGHQ